MNAIVDAGPSMVTVAVNRERWLAALQEPPPPAADHGLPPPMPEVRR
jgi:hypothetical protein